MAAPSTRLRIFFFITVLLALAAGQLTPGRAEAGNVVRVHFFMSYDCPHCKAEKAFLAKLKERYPSLEVVEHEVTRDPGAARLFKEMADAYGVRIVGVPATFIGEFPPIFGYQKDSTTGAQIESLVKYCVENPCPDPLDSIAAPPLALAPAPGGLLAPGQPDESAICPEDIPCIASEGDEGEARAHEEAGSPPKPREDGEAEAPPEAGQERAVPAQPAVRETVELPFFGTVEAAKVTLPVLTVTIAGLDGFNPCAFFVLFMLLGMLVHVHSRARMLLVGGIFVFFSGLIYFAFMAAWLNVFLLAGQIRFITFAAGLIALVIAVINIKDFFYFKRGVSLSIPESAKPKLFDRMRRLLKAPSLPSVIFGTIVLAIAANAYELLCTAGFPMVFTRVLTLHDLTTLQYYLYLVLYNVVYVVPLAIIVIVFTVTLGSRKLTEHQGQVLKLVSGVMMLYLALVILARPALLGNILVAAGLLAVSLATSALIVFVTGKLHRPA